MLLVCDFEDTAGLSSGEATRDEVMFRSSPGSYKDLVDLFFSNSIIPGSLNTSGKKVYRTLHWYPVTTVNIALSRHSKCRSFYLMSG